MVQIFYVYYFYDRFIDHVISMTAGSILDTSMILKVIRSRTESTLPHEDMRSDRSD